MELELSSNVWLYSQSSPLLRTALQSYKNWRQPEDLVKASGPNLVITTTANYLSRFITTCLPLGASFDVKEGYNANLILEPFNMVFDGGDNNDGITIIDITDLSHVRYCFVLWAGCDVFHLTK
jgi:hypothetical protein